eukprot:6076760-Alexandrium_andersonii.AAC.1
MGTRARNQAAGFQQLQWQGRLPDHLEVLIWMRQPCSNHVCHHVQNGLWEAVVGKSVGQLVCVPTLGLHQVGQRKAVEPQNVDWVGSACLQVAARTELKARALHIGTSDQAME